MYLMLFGYVPNLHTDTCCTGTHTTRRSARQTIYQQAYCLRRLSYASRRTPMRNATSFRKSTQLNETVSCCERHTTCHRLMRRSIFFAISLDFFRFLLSKYTGWRQKQKHQYLINCTVAERFHEICEKFLPVQHGFFGIFDDSYGGMVQPC